jgi:hypothetical protein
MKPPFQALNSRIAGRNGDGGQQFFRGAGV